MGGRATGQTAIDVHDERVNGVKAASAKLVSEGHPSSTEIAAMVRSRARACALCVLPSHAGVTDVEAGNPSHLARGLAAVVLFYP